MEEKLVLRYLERAALLAWVGGCLLSCLVAWLLSFSSRACPSRHSLTLLSELCELSRGSCFSNFFRFTCAYFLPCDSIIFFSGSFS